MDSLNRSIDLSMTLVERMMSDETVEILEFMNSKPQKFEGIYDCVLYAVVKCYATCFTLYPEDIAEANLLVKECLVYCNSKRKPRSFAATVAEVLNMKPNYKNFTEEQIHAELGYAYLTGMRGMLDFLKSNLINLVTGSYRLKVAYEGIEFSKKILKHHTFSSDKLEDAYTQLAKFGIGIANLCLAHVPKRFLRILQFIGYYGETEIAVKSLVDGCTDIKSVNLGAIICYISLTVYKLSIKQVLGNGCTKEDISLVEPIINRFGAQYPQSVFVRFLQGRLANLQGHLEQAMDYLQSALDIETKQLAIKLIPMLELVCCHTVQEDCRKAAKLVQTIRLETNISACCTSFCEAAFLLACEDITEEERKHANELLEVTPDSMTEYCGKHVPVEKFATKKARQYFAQDKFLMFPHYEIIYYANYFHLLTSKPDHSRKIINEIDQQLELLESRKDWQFYTDNYCLATLLKGLCLKDLGKRDEAIRCLEDVINRENEIFTDTQLVLCAHLEKGILETKAGNLEEALSHFKLAKKRRVFWIEFRIHGAKATARRLLNERRDKEGGD